jgi:hypothetical protein
LQSLFNAQIIQGNRLQVYPTLSPEPNGAHGSALLFRNVCIVFAFVRRQHDAAAQGNLLTNGMTLD